MPPRDASSTAREALVGAAMEAGTLIDVGRQPGLWGGGVLRGSSVPLMLVLGTGNAVAADPEQTANFVQRELIAAMSALGRSEFEVIFLSYPRALEEDQLDAVFSVLEDARQEGLFRHLGLFASGSALAAQSMWQFRDAFDLLLVRRNPLQHDGYDLLAPMAVGRRAEVITCGALDWGLGASVTVVCPSLEAADVRVSAAGDHPVVVGVRNSEEITTALTPGRAVDLSEAAKCYQDPAAWKAFASDDRPWVRQAAAKGMTCGSL